jgi:hypothetical protein
MIAIVKTEKQQAEKIVRAFAECLMGARRRISVLDLRNIRGYFRERILEEGKLIYEHE